MLVTYESISLWLTADEIGITNIDFTNQKIENNSLTKKQQTHLELAKKELLAYFSGELTYFTVPIHFQRGTDFQRKVWQALRDIPYGEIRSYQDIAIASGSPKAQQAVGQANRMNPIPIIVPCHRVIGKNGKLVGYSGNTKEGLAIKQVLLNLEKNKKD